MKKSRPITKLLSMALFVFAISACSSTTKVESDLGIKGAPDWVNEGTNILSEKDGRLFHGVGSAAPMGDMSLQKSVADDRARSEVARVLSSYMDVVSSDYMSSAKAGGANTNEEAVSRQIKALTKVNLGRRQSHRQLARPQNQHHLFRRRTGHETGEKYAGRNTGHER